MMIFCVPASDMAEVGLRIWPSTQMPGRESGMFTWRPSWRDRSCEKCHDVMAWWSWLEWERPKGGVELESLRNPTLKLRKSQVQRLTSQGGGDMINGWPVCVRRRGKTESDGSEKVYLLSICWTSLVTCQLLFHIHWFSSLLHLLLVPFFLDQNVFSTPTLSFQSSQWIG